jgi:hypothetical protein
VFIPDDWVDRIAALLGGLAVGGGFAWKKYFAAKVDLRTDEANKAAQNGFMGIVTDLRTEIARKNAEIDKQDKLIAELEIRADHEADLRWKAQERAAELETENARLKAKE